MVAKPAVKDQPNETPVRRRRTPSAAQVQRNQETRQKLIDAAAQLVGEHGYAGCSIARVTALAGVAHGAFYLHFKSQQDLFDILLPEVSAGMLRAISLATREAKTVEEMERRGFTANIAYIVEHPYVYRTMAEGIHYAPSAFAAHNELFVHGYGRAFKRLLGDRAPDERQLGELTAFLVGARDYIYRRFSLCDDGKTMKPLDQKVIDDYVAFMTAGVGRMLDIDPTKDYRTG